MTSLSTHVLDLTHGGPAMGVPVRLLRDGVPIAEAITDKDGRCPTLATVPVAAGHYALVFTVADYFRTRGVTLPDPPFLDAITLTFGMTDDSHYHVPLLVSPFGYSTYRGS